MEFNFTLPKLEEINDHSMFDIECRAKPRMATFTKVKHLSTCSPSTDITFEHTYRCPHTLTFRSA